MNLRVVHLLRKVERIDRDIEELDALMGTLQMDREYSARLRDSLVEESFRLRQLKQRINSQVIRIPPHFETMLSDGRRPEIAVRPDVAVRNETVATQPTLVRPQELAPPPERERDSAQARTTAQAKNRDTNPNEKSGSPVSENGSAASKTVERTETAPVRAPGADKKKPPFLFRFE